MVNFLIAFLLDFILDVSRYGESFVWEFIRKST